MQVGAHTHKRQNNLRSALLNTPPHTRTHTHLQQGVGCGCHDALQRHGLALRRIKGVPARQQSGHRRQRRRALQSHNQKPKRREGTYIKAAPHHHTRKHATHRPVKAASIAPVVCPRVPVSGWPSKEGSPPAHSCSGTSRQASAHSRRSRRGSVCVCVYCVVCVFVRVQHALPTNLPEGACALTPSPFHPCELPSATQTPTHPQERRKKRKDYAYVLGRG